jgi:hypothetical protein
MSQKASGDPADWRKAGLQIGAEFLKVASDNLRGQTGETSERNNPSGKMNWKPWAIGAGVLVAVVVAVLVFKRR